MKKINLLLLFITLFYFQTAHATKWYVDEASNVGDVFTPTSIAGNDANLGTPLSPWATMNFAITSASVFDTIFVDAGVYNQQFTVTKSLSIFGAGTNLTIFVHN